MKKLILITMLLGVCLTIHSQSLNLVAGSTWTSEANVFNDRSLSKAPIPFFTIGLAYQHTTNVNISLAYAFDLKIITLQTQIPLIAFKKKRNTWNYALLNSTAKSR